MRINRNIVCGMLIVGASAFAVSCSNQDDPGADDCYYSDYTALFNISANVNNTLSEFTNVDIDVTENEVTTKTGESWHLRYTMCAFPKEGSETDKPVFTVESDEPSFECKLPLGKYRIIIWADFSDSVNSASQYFHTDDFTDMLLKNKYSYQGCDEFKSCFVGEADVTVSYRTPDVNIKLDPAFGQYRLLPTDTPDYSVSKIVISYPDGLPSSLDIIHDRIAYYWSGVTFQPDSGNYFAFDNVLTSSQDTQIGMRIEVYDDRDMLRARRRLKDIPISRGGVTSISGKFYTVKEQDSSGGIPDGGGGIQVDYDESIFVTVTK